MLYVEMPFAQEHRERVLRLAGDTPVWFAEPDTRARDDRAALERARVAFGNCAPSWLAEAPDLRWLQLASVGVDAYAEHVPRLGDRGLVVTNLEGLFADPVAETCVAGLLALFRGIDRLVLAADRGVWEKPSVRPGLRLLGAARVLVLGTGSIGRRVVELVRPFGCRVTTFGRSAGDLRTVAELESALPGIDVVIGLLPGTEQTAGLLDARRLGLLPPGAVVVNAGRGSLIDEEALVAAVRDGRLGGAVLDVTREEPLPPGHPLWTAPNVILTQHTAGGTADELDRVIDVFVDNWRRFESESDLRNIVRWDRGY